LGTPWLPNQGGPAGWHCSETRRPFLDPAFDQWHFGAVRPATFFDNLETAQSLQRRAVVCLTVKLWGDALAGSQPDQDFSPSALLGGCCARGTVLDVAKERCGAGQRPVHRVREQVEGTLVRPGHSALGSASPEALQ